MSHLRSSSVAWLAAVLLIGGSACGEDDVPSDPGIGSKDVSVTSPAGNRVYSAGATAVAPDAGVGVASLADTQIMSVLSTINAGEIERSALAVDKAQTERVRELARGLSASHLAAQERLTALVIATSLSAASNVGNADSPVSLQLRTASQRVTTRLQNEAAASFDSVYLQAELDSHVKVLQLFDTQLLPSAKGPLLQAELERVRTDSMVDLLRVRGAATALDVDGDAGTPDVDAGGR